ncbi:MAG: hypothetical protein ABSF26_06390 [Thermoguttaceae bacterium]|jgi:hypothetical protein
MSCGIRRTFAAIGVGAAVLVMAAVPFAARAGERESTPTSCAMPDGSGLGMCLEKDEKPGSPLRLALRGGKRLGAYWRIEHYQRIVLGEMRGRVASVGVAHGVPDWAQRSYRVGCVKLNVNRLSPAMLFELEDADTLTLFAGAKTPFLMDTKWTPPPEYAKMVGPPRAPRNYALSDGNTVRLGTLTSQGQPVSLGPAEKGWLLLWYGADAWFLTGATVSQPLTGDRVNIAAGDAPMLMVFSRTPTVRLTGDEGMGPEGSLVLTFPKPGAKMVLLPLLGHRLPPAAETKAWSSGGSLRKEIIARCDWWAERLAEFPHSVRETARYDAASDAAVFHEQFTFVTVRAGGRRFAPLPPVLELARQRKFPIVVTGTVEQSGLETYCGPYAGVSNAERYEVRIAGLTKYAREAMGQPAVSPPYSNPGAGAVEARLKVEIDRVLAAGHLTPFDLPFKTSWYWGNREASQVRLLYSAPGQSLSTLARTLPYLDGPRRQKVLEYMRAERAAFPPETVDHLPYDKGARREVAPLPQYKRLAHFAAWNFHQRTKTVPAESLYDLACYYQAVGPDRIKSDGVELREVIQRTLEPWFQRIEWATLGWYSWPEDLRDKEYCSYGWNLIHEVNRYAAACIGLARLARWTNDGELESLALVQLSRSLTHRYALQQYPRWLYSCGGFLLQPEGFDPADDPQCVHLTEKEAILDGGGGWDLDWQTFGRFREVYGPLACMVPEVARFSADYLKPEAEGFAKAVTRYHPDAFLALGTPRNLEEWWHNYPQDAQQIFLCHAWVLGKNGDWLRRRLDVPLVPVGDWYYIDKLVACLHAYSPCGWSPAGAPSQQTVR